MNSAAPKFRNAAEELLGQSFRSGLERKTAFADDSRSFSFATAQEMVNCAANALRETGLEPRERLLLCLSDSGEFVVSFLGAIQSGIVPIPVNTLWTAEDLAYALANSLAKAAVVSMERLTTFLEAMRIAGWSGQVIVAGRAERSAREAEKYWQFERLLAKASSEIEPWTAPPEGECFWLYSSGSTGRPKAAMHVQRSLAETARLYAQGVLGMGPEDEVYSAAKLSFAYGLGNGLSFPLYVCALSTLCAARPTPEVVARILRERRPTIFFGVPSQFATLLQSKELPRCGEHRLRFCVSAGEALPAELGRAWKERTGVDVIDGIGSTEMLHIFISNRPGEVVYGTSGRPTPGYKVKLLDEAGEPTRPGEIGDLWVSGPTCCTGYWNEAEKTRSTFIDGWTRTGDKYVETQEGSYTHCGRADEMLKVGGLWVSPLEVESALKSHAAVMEAAVIGCEDEQGLVKPKAFVTLKPGYEITLELEEELKLFVKNRLAPYKYPRWIKFVPHLPRTATGKLKRVPLREL